MPNSQRVYEVRPRKDKRGVDLISDVLPFGRLWYPEAPDAIEHAKFYSRSHDAVISVYDDAGSVIGAHEHAKEHALDYAKSRVDFSWEAEIMWLTAVMDEQSDKEIAAKKQRDQMLKLVAKGFYNELTNYGVRKDEIIWVASHLLDNLLAQEKKPAEGVEYYNRIFTLASVNDEWAERKQIMVQQVALRTLQPPVVSKVTAWLKVPAVRESFVPAFPENEAELQKYFTHPTREYFAIYYNDQPVGLVGGENFDLRAGKLEMKKLVGESGLQGKGIGKRATFGFLYYAFMIRNLNKVYIHSPDINMRNINLNSRFGFELEGVFLDDIRVGDKHQDIVRMALFKPRWLQIFSRDT
jgi:RimJ/RimL family protein N-acetyltransferase